MKYQEKGTTGLAIVITVLDENGSQWQLAVSKTADEKPEFSGVVIEGKGLKSQLSSIFKKNPGVTLESACKQLRVRSISADNIERERLEQLVERFTSIRVSPLINGPFVLHGNFYRIWVFSAANHGYFEFYGVPEQADDPNPLKCWADDLLKEVGSG